MSNPLLDNATGAVVYNNFVKIADWLIKGTDSEHKMPPALGALFSSAAEGKAGSANAAAAISAIQQHMTAMLAAQDAQKNAINQLIATVTALQGVVAELQASVNSAGQAPSAPVVEPAAETMQLHTPEPAPASIPAMPDLGAFGAPVAPQQAPEQPAPQPTLAGDAGTSEVELLAAKVDAGDLNPAALQALDAEIAKLMNGG